MKQIGGVINVGAAFNHQVVSLGVTQGETIVTPGVPMPPQIVNYTQGIATGVGVSTVGLGVPPVGVVPPIAVAPTFAQSTIVAPPLTSATTYGVSGYGAGYGAGYGVGYGGVGYGAGYGGVGYGAGYGGVGYGGVAQTPGVVTNVDYAGNVTQTPVVVTNTA